jgi:small-conductance mechanosensitive channel
LFQSAETIIVTILGILLGLVFEGAGRARYLGQAASNPALFDHVAKAYRIVLILGVIVGSIYLLLNIWVIYVAYTYGMVITITSAQESGTIIGIIRYIALALVFIWLSAEPQKDTVPPMLNVKKFLILSAIYCSMMAILNLFGLSMYKVSDTVPPSVQLSATSSVKAGK